MAVKRRSVAVKRLTREAARHIALMACGGLAMLLPADAEAQREQLRRWLVDLGLPPEDAADWASPPAPPPGATAA